MLRPAGPRQKSPGENENGSRAPSLQRSATVHCNLRSPRQALRGAPAPSSVEAGERQPEPERGLGSGARSSMGGALGRPRNSRNPAARQTKQETRSTQGTLDRAARNADPFRVAQADGEGDQRISDQAEAEHGAKLSGPCLRVSAWERRRTTFRPGPFDSWTLPGVLKGLRPVPEVRSSSCVGRRPVLRQRGHLFLSKMIRRRRPYSSP